MMPKRRETILLLTAIIATILGLGLLVRVLTLEPSAPPSPTPDAAVQTPPELRIGGPFELTDQTGRTVTDRDLRGEFALVYFGYTFCPDICPAELQTMSDAIDELGEDGAQVRPVFITVDPERDTVKTLADYVGNFHPRLLGLTGTPEQIAAAAKSYRVYYAKTWEPGTDRDAAAADYLMNHSTFVYLIGPDGVLRVLFRRGTSATDMAGRIRQAIEAESGS